MSGDREAVLHAFRHGDVDAVEALLPHDAVALLAYLDLCRGRPYVAVARIESSALPPAAFPVALLVEAFRGSRAIESLPDAIHSNDQSLDDGGVTFPELEGIPKPPLNEDVELLRAEARRAPNDARAQFRLGETLAFHRGEHARGRAHLENAVRLAPHRALYWGMLGELIYKHTNALEAIEYYNRAIIAEPTGPRWRLYRALVLGRIFLETLASAYTTVDTRQEWLRESNDAVTAAEMQLRRTRGGERHPVAARVAFITPAWRRRLGLVARAGTLGHSKLNSAFSF